MLARNVGRRYIDIGVTRLSRIDEEQVDRVSINYGNESPMSSSDCSSSQSTPLPPFPSPPFLPTPPPLTGMTELMTTPPPPPPPEDCTSSPLSMMSKMTSVDVDSVVYSRVDEHGRTARDPCGIHVRPQTSIKPNDVVGFEKETAAVRFIKEKYDSLGRALIERTLTYDSPSPPPIQTDVDLLGSGGVKLGGGGSVRIAAAAASPPPLTSPYQVPSSIPCCRAAMPPTTVGTSVAANQSFCSGGCSATLAVRCSSSTEHCQSSVGRQSQHVTATQSCQHQQPQLYREYQQQQQQQHQQQQHYCCHRGLHTGLQSSHDDFRSTVDSRDMHDIVPVPSNQSSSVGQAGDASISKSISMSGDQRDNRPCCPQQQKVCMSRTDLPPSPERQVQQQQQQQQQQMKTALPATDSTVVSTSGDIIHSSVLSDHEQTQIDLFYRSHKTLVAVSQCVARLSLSPHVTDHTAADVDPTRSTPSSAGKTRPAAAIALLPSALDERNWTPTSVNGVPVAVLDTGSGRRRRCLSIVMAERGTGFEIWRTSIDRLSNNHYRFDRGSSEEISFVPDKTTDGASMVVHLVVCVRDSSKIDNVDCRTNGGSQVSWARLSFEDQTAASEFARQLERMVADVEGVGGQSSVVGTKTKQGSKPTTSDGERRLSSTNKKKPGNFRKADISQPCCFSHVTRIERTEAAVSGGLGSLSTGSSGLRGILRGGFGGALRGLAAAVSAAGTAYNGDGSITEKDSV